MRPVPHQHMRAAYVIALDIPIPPPPYLMPDLEIIARWLRGVIELGLEHADQEDVALSAVCDAAFVLDDPDLVKFIGARDTLGADDHLRELRRRLGTEPAPQDASGALRKMARRLVHERRKARLWQQKYEGLQRNISWTQKRLESAGVLADIEHQEALLALDYRPGRTFPPRSPEPDCARVASVNGVVWQRERIGRPPFQWWRAVEPHGDGTTYSWKALNHNNDPLTLIELLPLV